MREIIMEYEVYIARLSGLTMYVGEGKTDRHTHITSGTSHCYEANRSHFMRDDIQVEVIKYNTKEEVVAREKELIEELNPLWNKTYGHWQLLLSARRLRNKQLKKIKYRLVTNLKQQEVLDYVTANMDVDGVCHINSKSMTDLGLPKGFCSMMQVTTGKFYLQIKKVLLFERLPIKGQYKVTWVYKEGV